MSDIGIRSSITKFLPENFRVRDLRNAIPVDTSVPRARNEFHSFLGMCMQAEESPFSHRQLMVTFKNASQKKSLKSSNLDELIVLREKLSLSRAEFTPDAYGNMMDLVDTVADVKSEIRRNAPLSELTVREKNAFQEKLGFYEDHFKWVLTGFSNAKFPEKVNVNEVLGQVKELVHQVLQSITEVSASIKMEIRPSVADLQSRLYA